MGPKFARLQESRAVARKPSDAAVNFNQSFRPFGIAPNAVCIPQFSTFGIPPFDIPT